MRWYGSLRRAGEIAFVRRSGRRASAEGFAAHAAESHSAPSRVAIAVSKAVGNAVLRNRVKRRIKGALDALPAPGTPIRLVVTVRPSAAAMPYDVLARQIGAALVRLAGPATTEDAAQGCGRSVVAAGGNRQERQPSGLGDAPPVTSGDRRERPSSADGGQTRAGHAELATAPVRPPLT